MSLRESYFARSICKPARLYDELNDDSTKAFSASTPGRSQKGYLEWRTSGRSPNWDDHESKQLLLLVVLVLLLLELCIARSIAYYEPEWSVTGQLADKPTRGQSSHGLVNSRTTCSQLAEMFDFKFGVYDSSKCYIRQITPFIYAVNIRYGYSYG